MKLGKQLAAVAMAATFSFTLAACEKNEGPMEKAGKEADQATDQVGRKVEKAGESIQDAAKGQK